MNLVLSHAESKGEQVTPATVARFCRELATGSYRDVIGEAARCISGLCAESTDPRGQKTMIKDTTRNLALESKHVITNITRQRNFLLFYICAGFGISPYDIFDQKLSDVVVLIMLCPRARI